ncbi:cysteine--tRNA ligase [Arthrospira platensis]|uniref:cysteine--tRNA ligase n=1 Tax=Limnospira platensis TaxID=118562 RepID=UPI0007A0F99A|nr:cysteine--tRNA ligase [Arthrospira platensis YZ]
MVLKIYNTQTRQKETFTTLEPGKVKMYCCGVTVYDYCHLGHARSYTTWDVVRRYLEWSGYEVNYVQNFTDIDDKILNRAKEQESTMEAVSQRFIDAYFEDLRRLNVRDAKAYPRVTDHIKEIHQLIEQLTATGHAYAVDGDVYYNVGHFPDYGKLSRRQLEDLQMGASGRVAVADPETLKKKNPADFALWKAAKPGEPAWDSPWGPGRPGWHIECSAMVRQLLGETIDIHGGGGDLVFPHHENEIAQSEAATGKTLARYWMHNGMVTVGGEKMSKSLGNFTTIRELLDRPVDPMVVRLFILQGHYRKPLDFTDEAIASAKNGWETLKDGLLFAEQYGARLGWSADSSPSKYDTTEDALQRFRVAMDDDFNTPGGLAVLFALAKELRRQGNLLAHEGKTDTPSDRIYATWKTLVELAGVFGLEAVTQAQPPAATQGISDAEIEDLVKQRQSARKAKNYAEGDRIRDQLQANGVTLIDRPGGETLWRR